MIKFNHFKETEILNKILSECLPVGPIQVVYLFSMIGHFGEHVVQSTCP